METKVFFICLWAAISLGNNNANAFLFWSSTSSSSDIHRQITTSLKYKTTNAESDGHHHHHPHLQQGGGVFESKIQTVVQQDIDCPLLRRKNIINNNNNSNNMNDRTKSTTTSANTLLPRTIDSLPPDLLDMDEFLASMQVQIRQRVPSFNARGYHSSVISDIKEKKIGETNGVLEGTPEMMTRFNIDILPNLHHHEVTNPSSAKGKKKTSTFVSRTRRFFKKKIRDHRVLESAIKHRWVLFCAIQWLLLAIVARRM
eukprot:scaffold6081_cov101-Cylindrotheca_fusiformis.AAC.5